MYLGAVDIGGTNILAGVVDETGRVAAWRSFPTRLCGGAKGGVTQIVRMLDESLEEAGLARSELAGIGAGSTGPVYPALGTIGAVEFLPGWEGAHLTQMLADVMGVSVVLENDADAWAMGEWAWGTGRGSNSFLLVTLGTGIGVALVLDGRIYRGVDGSHPEIGHHFIDPAGPVCACGGRGCWESLASGGAMERWGQANHPQGLRRTAKELCAAARQGEPLAAAVVERTAAYLATGFANLVTLFSPEIIAVGGGLAQSWDLFWPAVERAVQTRCAFVPHERTSIILAAGGPLAGLTGAAQAWISRQAG